MLNDLMMFATIAAATYAWLCAIVAPLVTAARSCVRAHATRRALAGLALACSAAVLWTVLPIVLALVALMLEPRVGLALLQARIAAPGLGAGLGVWLLRFAVDQRLPRLGSTFETATAIAIVAAVNDNERTLGRVEALYREVAVDDPSYREVRLAPRPSATAWSRRATRPLNTRHAVPGRAWDRRS